MPVNPYGYIYIVENKTNLKKYIGQHKSHSFDETYLGSGIFIQKAIKKYGKDNFKIEVIEWCQTKEELDEREKYWISFYDAVNSKDFYNRAFGGYGMTSEAVTLGKNSHAKKVICVETKEEYDCIKSAAKSLGRDVCSVRRAIYNNTRCAGYHLRFKDESDYLNREKFIDRFGDRVFKKGNRHTEDSKKKMSEHSIGNRVFENMKPVIAIFSKRRYECIEDAKRDGIEYSYYRGMKLTLDSIYRNDFWIYEDEFSESDDKDKFMNDIMERFAKLEIDKKIQYDKSICDRCERLRLKSHKASLRMREINKNKDYHGESNSMYGKHHSQETKDKIRDIHKGKCYNVKRIKKVIDLETGEIFGSVVEASKIIGRSPSTLVTQISKNRRCNGRLLSYF